MTAVEALQWKYAALDPTSVAIAAMDIARIKTAVFGDLPHDVTPGLNLMRDRERSLNFRDHEKRHVLGHDGEGYIAFPDAAAHAGLALHAYRNPGMAFVDTLPADLRKLLSAPAGINKYYQTSAERNANNSVFLPMRDRALVIGQRPTSNLLSTIHTRPVNTRGEIIMQGPDARRLLVHPAFAEFGQDVARRSIVDPTDFQRLRSIVAPPIPQARPAPTLPRPRGFKTLDRR